MKVKTEQLYEYLADEEDARVCKDIDEAACREVPGNFFKLLGSQFLTKLGDALSSPKIVLPWLFGGLGVPAFFTGLLVPLRESGSLLPQLFIGGVIRRFAMRKWFIVAGCVLQALAVAGMAVAALTLQGAAAGWVFIALLAGFSLARGLCSVASKDVLGKTIPKTRRGRVGGYSTSLAGAITIGVGIVLALEARGSTGQYIALLCLAAMCWVVAAFFYANVKEYPGATDGGGNAFKQAMQNLTLLIEDAPFRHFVLVRALMMSSGLAAPFFILLARESDTSSGVASLGWFVALGGLAGLVSGPFWGRFADTSSRRVMLGTSLVTALLCAALALLAYLKVSWLAEASLLLFMSLTLTHEGVRLGRKTYIVDLASGNRRTDYVSVSNTVIGILLLLVGLLAAGIASWSTTAALALFSASAAAAALLGLTLPETT